MVQPSQKLWRGGNDLGESPSFLLLLIVQNDITKLIDNAKNSSKSIILVTKNEIKLQRWRIRSGKITFKTIYLRTGFKSKFYNCRFKLNPKISKFKTYPLSFRLLASTMAHAILSHFTILKSHFINYTILFYNILSIPTFILPFYTLK